MKKFLQGIGLGIAIVLPGISGGTAFIIYGFYHKFISDLSRMHLRPYLSLFAGTAIGIIASSELIGLLLQAVPDLLVSFLLGALLASVRLVLPQRPKFTLMSVAAVCGGFSVAWFLSSEPLGSLQTVTNGSLLLYLIGGILSSATMLLPGVSGSAVLVVMGLYDDVIFALNQLQFPKLFILTCGWGIGLLGFARILSSLYRQHFQALSFLLAGLIIGSGKTLLPASISPGAFLAFAAGAILVALFGGKE